MIYNRAQTIEELVETFDDYGYYYPITWVKEYVVHHTYSSAVSLARINDIPSFPKARKEAQERAKKLVTQEYEALRTVDFNL